MARKHMNNKIYSFCKRENSTQVTIFIDTTYDSNRIFVARIENKNYRESYIRQSTHFGKTLKEALQLIRAVDGVNEIVVFSRTRDGLEIDRIQNLALIDDVMLEDDQFKTKESVFDKFNEVIFEGA